MTFAAMTCSLAALRAAVRAAEKLRATGRDWMRTGAPRRADEVIAMAIATAGSWIKECVKTELRPDTKAAGVKALWVPTCRPPFQAYRR